MRFDNVFNAHTVAIILQVMRCFTVAGFTALGVWYAYMFYINHALSGPVESMPLTLKHDCCLRSKFF